MTKREIVFLMLAVMCIFFAVTNWYMNKPFRDNFNEMIETQRIYRGAANMYEEKARKLDLVTIRVMAGKIRMDSIRNNLEQNESLIESGGLASIRSKYYEGQSLGGKN